MAKINNNSLTHSFERIKEIFLKLALPQKQTNFKNQN